jgi:hypothetical protein
VEARHESVDDPASDDLDSTQGRETGRIEEIGPRRLGV